MRSLKFGFSGTKRQWVFPKVRPKGNGERGRPACLLLRHSVCGPKKSARRCEKPEKSFSTVLQRQPIVSHSVPQKTRPWHFSDFSRNFRGYPGEGVADFTLNPNPNPNMAQLPVHPVHSWPGEKIKVNQACSRLIKVNQAILKHFFYALR
jgi:hypothetical protein